MCMDVCLQVHLCTMCKTLVQGSRRGRALDPRELELQGVLTHYVVGGN